MPKHISTHIEFKNIGPLKNLDKTIESNALKIAIFAENGSGKTFISKLFRLTENTATKNNNDENLHANAYVNLNEKKGEFSFSVTDKNGNTKENFQIEITKGALPTIPKTNYIYHTFNQDYADENIANDKDGDIQGEINSVILGKENIDLQKLDEAKNEKQTLCQNTANHITNFVEKNLQNISVKQLLEYKTLNYQKYMTPSQTPTMKIQATQNLLTHCLKTTTKSKTRQRTLPILCPYPKPIVKLTYKPLQKT